MYDCVESNIFDVFLKFYVMDGFEKKIFFSFKIFLMRVFILICKKYIFYGLCLY